MKFIYLKFWRFFLNKLKSEQAARAILLSKPTGTNDPGDKEITAIAILKENPKLLREIALLNPNCAQLAIEQIKDEDILDELLENQKLILEARWSIFQRLDENGRLQTSEPRSQAFLKEFFTQKKKVNSTERAWIYIAAAWINDIEFLKDLLDNRLINIEIRQTVFRWLHIEEKIKIDDPRTQSFLKDCLMTKFIFPHEWDWQIAAYQEIINPDEELTKIYQELLNKKTASDLQLKKLQSPVILAKKCGNCGKPVSSSAHTGQFCPHCGAQWRFTEEEKLP